MDQKWPCFDPSWFQFSWFFFELIVKSMAQHLFDSDKLKVKWHTICYSRLLFALVLSDQTDCGWVSFAHSIFPQLLRPQRFPSSYLSRVETLVETVSEHIFWKNKELPEETRSANLAVAAFVKVREKKKYSLCYNVKGNFYVKSYVKFIQFMCLCWSTRFILQMKIASIHNCTKQFLHLC